LFHLIAQYFLGTQLAQARRSVIRPILTMGEITIACGPF